MRRHRDPADELFEEGYTQISYAWRLGYREIPSVRVWRSAMNFGARFQTTIPAWVIMGIILLVLPGIYMLQCAVTASAINLRIITWLTIFIGFQITMVWCAYKTWTFVGMRANQIDDLVTAQQASSITKWFLRHLSQTKQWTFILAIVSGSLGYVWYNRSDIEQAVPLTAVSFVSLAISTALGGSVLYWLIFAPSLVRRIVQSGPLRLRWYSPASTPGIRLLADGMGLASILMLGGSMSIALFGFILPSATTSTSLTNLLLVFGLVVFAITIRTGLMPFVWIYKAIVDSKRRTLQSLATGLQGGEGPPAVVTDELLARASLYEQVDQTPNMPFSTGAIVQYGGVLVGSLIAYITSIVLQH